MHLPLRFAVATLCIVNSVTAQTSREDQAVRVFSELSFSVERVITNKSFFRMVIKPEQANPKMYCSGSGWVTNLGEDSVLVTAAHNLGLKVRIDPIIGQLLVGNQITDTNNKYRLSEWTLTDLHVRCILGGLSYKPKAIALFPRLGSPPESDEQLDLALVRTDKAFFKGVPSLLLRESMPRRHEKVTAIGFSGTDSPQPKDNIMVAAVYKERGFFVLNESLGQGYSGGVVIDTDGRACGVITSVTPQQTTVLAVSRELLHRAKWHEAEEVLEAPLKYLPR